MHKYCFKTLAQKSFNQRTVLSASHLRLLSVTGRYHNAKYSVT